MQRVSGFMKLSGVLLLACSLWSCQAKTDGAAKAKADSTATVKPQSAVFNVPSADCPSCSRRIKTAATSVDGVQDVYVDLSTHKATVKFIAARANVRDIQAAITNAGYAPDAKSDAAVACANDATDKCDEKLTKAQCDAMHHAGMKNSKASK
ncbi:MAG: heavy metal-associated domain-containing protein [Candidatus Kapaibacterium sp.]|jgi:copper chaperone CopZ